MKPNISVVICAFNSEDTIKKILESIVKQEFHDYEIIVVDDHSTDNTYRIIKNVANKYKIKFFRNKKNYGVAFSRNMAINKSIGDIIAFTDADCKADKNWLRNIYGAFKNKKVKAVMGKVRIPNANYIGNAISALGYPGGANLGFEKMWNVDKNSFTNHLTGCNFAIRREVFNEVGMFDEDFPKAGGEDTEFSYRLNKKGIAAKYCEKALIWHVPRSTLREFLNWHINRGRSNYCLKKKIGSLKGFIRLRLWSSKNIIKYGLMNPLYFPMIIFLLALSYFSQQIGYYLEKTKDWHG